MNRRDLLLGALATAALGVGPLSFAGVSPSRRRALLSEAWERAAKRARPLLVVIVDEDAGWERGRRMGIWLNHAADEDLAPLALVEPVCATLAELDRLVPGVSKAKDAWFVLVRVDQPTPTWRSIVVLDAVPAARPAPDRSSVVIAAERQAFAGSVLRVLKSEGLTASTRAAAADARARWVTAAPPGAHWATDLGCGTSVEYAATDPDPGIQLGVRCGMGHAEPYEARFLAFYDVFERS